MADKEVTIYTLPTWPHCHKAKEYLSQKGIAFTEIDVSKDKDKVQEMVQKSGQLGTPVIIVNGEVLVGFNQKKLDDLLK